MACCGWAGGLVTWTGHSWVKRPAGRAAGRSGPTERIAPRLSATASARTGRSSWRGGNQRHSTRARACRSGGSGRAAKQVAGRALPRCSNFHNAVDAAVLLTVWRMRLTRNIVVVMRLNHAMRHSSVPPSASVSRSNAAACRFWILG